MVGKKGALSVVASGNDGVNVDDQYTSPACIDSDYIISVAASNENDELATFSNYGKDNVVIGTQVAQCLHVLPFVQYQHGQRTDDIEACDTQNEGEEEIRDEFLYFHDAENIGLLYIFQHGLETNCH